QDVYPIKGFPLGVEKGVGFTLPFGTGSPGEGENWSRLAGVSPFLGYFGWDSGILGLLAGGVFGKAMPEGKRPLTPGGPREKPGPASPDPPFVSRDASPVPTPESAGGGGNFCNSNGGGRALGGGFFPPSVQDAGWLPETLILRVFLGGKKDTGFRFIRTVPLKGSVDAPTGPAPLAPFPHWP
ncbi:hypothetical protein JTB14_010271, partial [Gonioctena quinquepunctata]